MRVGTPIILVLSPRSLIISCLRTRDYADTTWIRCLSQERYRCDILQQSAGLPLGRAGKGSFFERIVKDIRSPSSMILKTHFAALFERSFHDSPWVPIVKISWVVS